MGKRIAPEVLDLVTEMWRTGLSRQTIQVVISKRYTVTHRQVRRYIYRVEKQFAAQQEEERPAKRSQILAALEAFLERAMKAEDLRAQAIGLERLCKVYGLDAPTSVNVTGALTAGVTLTDEQEAARLAELRAKQDGK